MELTNEAKQNKNEVISFLSRVEVSVSDFSSPPLAWIAVGDDHNSGRISNLLSPCISRSREIRHFVGNEPKNKTPRPNTVPPPPLQGLLFLFPLFPDLSEFVLVFKKSKILLALAFSYSLIQTSTFDVIAHLLYTTFVTSASKQMTQSQSRGPQTRIYSVRLREKSKSSEICFCWLFLVVWANATVACAFDRSHETAHSRIHHFTWRAYYYYFGEGKGGGGCCCV